MNTSKILPIILFILLALTVSLSACREGTVTEAVGIDSPETPTKTKYPTITRTITSVPTENYQPIVVSEQTVTEQARLTLITQYHANCEPEQFLVSPDSNWMASSCKDEKTLFLVSNQDGYRSWEIPYEVPSFDDISWSSSFCIVIQFNGQMTVAMFISF